MGFCCIISSDMAKKDYSPARVGRGMVDDYAVVVKMIVLELPDSPDRFNALTRA